MLRRSSVVSSFLVVGGCAAAREETPLRSIERGEGLRVSSSLIDRGELERARRSPAVVMRNGKPSVVCGCSSPGVNEDTVEEWRGDRFVSIEGCKDTVARSCASYCSTSNGRSFIIGGFDGLECLRQITVMDKSGSMTELASFPSRLKNGAACAVKSRSGQNDVIVVIGGWDEQRTMRTIYAFRENGCNTPEMVGLLPRSIEAHAVVTVD
ncbi:hypothetical protein PFISCL1PPCAC_20437, partial [Pristionchus fissidentatus]